MNPRRRAIALIACAVTCAFLAVGIARRLEPSSAGSLGSLREVVVTTRPLPQGVPLGQSDLEAWTIVRRVPLRFLPPDAVSQREAAVGLIASNEVPAGSYLLRSHLTNGRTTLPANDSPSGSRQPVEIAVSGAGALLLGGRTPEGTRVDVVAAREPGFESEAKAGVIARSALLMALRRPQASGDSWRATLAVDRDEALSLIAAETSGRQLRLLPLGAGRR